jgi:hypothetical protein
MSSFTITVDKVVSFEDASERAHAVLRLATGQTLKVRRSDPRFDVWSGILRERQASGEPVYVESDPLTREVRNVFLPSARQIESLTLDPEARRLKVIMFMAPSLYFLSGTREDFEEVHQRLQQSIRDNAKVLVTAHPDTHEILDVRRP